MKRKTTEEELDALNQQLRASNQQLEASNQQLRATEQQLRASNQQMEAANQQLRATEEHLRESEERFRGVFESRMIGTLFWNANGDITDANEKFCQMLGYIKDDILSKKVRWRDMTPPEYEEQDYKALTEIASTGAMTPIEKEYIHKDGSRIPIILGAASLPGPTLNGVAFVLDITDRKKFEEALWLKNQVFEDSIAALSIADINGTITEVNPAFLTLWGYGSKEEAIGGSVASFFVNEEDAGPVLEALGTSGRWEGDFLARRANGATFISRGLATAMKNERGELIGYQSANLDVSEQRRIEEERKRILDLSNDLICIAGMDGYFKYVNPAWQKTLGYTEEELLSRPFLEVIHPDDHPSNDAAVDKLTGGNVLDAFENRYIHKDGSIRVISWKATSIPEQQQMYCVGRDVTEERTYRDHLEELVEERTVELTATNKELEAFAYSVSHDLRAPLRGIDGFSKALLDDYQDKLDDTGKDYLNRVRAGTQRMGTLIDDLLELSRLTRTEMHRQRLDLGEMARKITIELQRDEPDRRAEFEIAPGLTGSGDRVLVEAALENLLRNAWKFTGQCERATIEVGVTAHDGERVYHVRDNGAGFDMAYADKLFGPFQRLHDATEYPGTGIGLAIVHRVILRHGGRVWAEGEVDKGATFYFTLPTASGKADQGA